MSTHNIGFYEDWTKISLNYHQISFSSSENMTWLNVFCLFTYIVIDSNGKGIDTDSWVKLTRSLLCIED